MKFCSEIHVPLRMNYNNFGDRLTCPLDLCVTQNLTLSDTLVYDKTCTCKTNNFHPKLYFVFHATCYMQHVSMQTQNKDREYDIIPSERCHCELVSMLVLACSSRHRHALVQPQRASSMAVDS